jgi:hypothetical protein
MNRLGNILRNAFSMLLLAVFLYGFTWAQPADAPKLPTGLSDSEAQQIRKEQNPKGYIEVVLRLADARLQQAFKQVSDTDVDETVKRLQVYGALLAYADAHARSLPASATKERNKLLKLVEQAIFKQQRTIEGTRQELPYEQREATESIVANLKRIRLRALNDILGNGEIIK